MNVRGISVLIAVVAWSGWANALSPYRVLTLNLHGYHPTDEAPRFLETRKGRVESASSDIYYFTREEWERGHRKRLDRLAADIASLAPDLLFFQEVAAGEPESPKNCNNFDSPEGVEQDRSSANSVLRLNHRLAKLGQGYQALLSCRGNVGWITDANTFQNQRVLRKTADGRYEPVFDFGSNPYPNGVLLEGLALLVGPRWKVLETTSWKVTVPGNADVFHVQIAALAPNSGEGWVVAANIHGAHKLRAFEQAIALRHGLLNYVARRKERFGPRFLGPLVAGDLNSRLYRPGLDGDEGEIGGLAWELAVPGYFNARKQPDNAQLTTLLHEYNQDTRYKEWANINNPKEARSRIRSAVAELQSLLKNGALPYFDALWNGRSEGRCENWLREFSPSIQAACSRPALIDHVFVEESSRIQRAAVIYSHNDWVRPDSLTDHPGLLVELNY